jgi:hypothetical protein
MRTSILLFICLFAFPSASAQIPFDDQVQFDESTPFNRSLEYEESSSGLQIPEWESGKSELEMGDVNGDGFVDILSIGDHGSPYIGTDKHGIMVYFGNGTGADWSVYQNGNFGYGGLALGDVNNDGFMDVGYGMHHNYSGHDFGDQLIEVALGDGTGKSWTPWDDNLATHGQSYGMFGTDFADVDVDGDLDLVSISFGYGDGLHVYLNNGDGTWTRSFGYLDGNSSCEVSFGDVNGDGYPDIAAGHKSGTIFLGDGTGGFANADGNLPTPGGYGFHSGADLGDVDGDGCQDVSFCTSSGSVEVWLWGGNNRWFPLCQGLPSSSKHHKTQLCDMDADGFLDLVAFGEKTGTVWKLDETDTWVQAASYQTPGNPGYCEAFRTGFDVDFNGRPDIVLLSEEGSWPYDINYLRFFREKSKPVLPKVRLTFPRGNENFILGSVIFIDWLSAVPGSGGGSTTVSLALSTSGPAGPWTDIETLLPNNGRYQWLIPTGLSPSSDCRLKITLNLPSGSLVYKMAKSFKLD